MSSKYCCGRNILLVAGLAAGVCLPSEPQVVLDLGCRGRLCSYIFSDRTYITASSFPEFVGDVNGDGADDFVLATASRTIADHGDWLLVYGQPGSRYGDIDMTQAPTTRFFGPKDVYPSRDNFGGFVDLDGDGYGDLLLGISRTPGLGIDRTGGAYVIYGSASLPEEIDLAALEQSGVRHAQIVSRQEGLYFGRQIDGAGDLNGDGKTDIALSGNIDAGGAGLVDAIYFLYGGFAPPETFDVAEIGFRVPGFVLRWANKSDGVGCCGQTFKSAGDVNGDGFQDFAFGAPARGSVYILLGGRDFRGIKEIGQLLVEGSLVEILGPGGSGSFGRAVSGAGDVDGDGFADILVGAPLISRAYVIFGKPVWAAVQTLSDLRTTTLRGKPPELLFGTSSPITGVNITLGSGVTGVGDFNGDGFDDFMVTNCVQVIDWNLYVGEGYVVFGNQTLPDTIDMADVGTTRCPGFAIRGEQANDKFGDWVDGGGDFDGDGRPDFLVSIPRWEADLRAAVPPVKQPVAVFYGGTDLESLQVFGVDPVEASVDGGTELRLCGTGFTGRETVEIDGRAASAVEARSSAELRVTVPAGTAGGAVDIDVRGDGGQVHLAKALTYVESAGYPDLVLDPEWLGAHGYRSMEFADTQSTIPSISYRSFLNTFIGDLNGDGIDDLVVGEPLGGPEGLGRVSIIFGRSALLPNRIGVGETQRYGTVILCGASLFGIGLLVAFPGDLNGDGLGELALGASEPLGGPAGGGVYILPGRRNWPPLIDLEEEAAQGKCMLIRNTKCGVPFAAGPGDMSGDGIPDLAVGFWGDDSPCRGEASEVWIFGQGLTLGEEDPVPNILIQGDPELIPFLHQPDTGGDPPEARVFGATIQKGGDLNGDGAPDLIAEGHHTGRGAGYFVFGGVLRDGYYIVDLLASGRGVIFPLEAELGWTGIYAAGLGDFNGDGIDDAAFGLPAAGFVYDGKAFVVFGSRQFGSVTTSIDLFGANDGGWLTIDGEYSYDWSGYVHALGDVNGDGLADLGITSSGHSNTRGRGYVIFGRRNPPESIRLRDAFGTGGFRVTSSAAENWLSAMFGGMSAGDLDGDGYRDLAIGERLADASMRVLVIFGRGPSRPGYVRTGDANDDRRIDIADAVRILTYLFAHGNAPGCMKAADVNDDENVNIADAVTLLGYLFAGGAIKLPDGRSVLANGHPGCVKYGESDVPAEMHGMAGCAGTCN